LFLHCFSRGHEALQVIAIQIITDILTSHPSLISQPTPSAEKEEVEPNELIKPIYKMYSKSLRLPDVTVQANGCTALSKLMLAGTIKDADLLKQLVLAYFDPETQGNPSLRQALTYFLPVYCHSRAQNAESLAHIAVNVIHTLAERADDLDEEEEMVGLSLVGAQICDWTDPRKCVSLNDKSPSGKTDGHLVLAEEVIEKILSPGCTKEERKHYVPILSKLYISPTTPTEVLHSLSELVAEALDSKVANEAACRNALNKLQTAISKLFVEDERNTEEGDAVAGAVDVPDAAETDIVDANDLTMLTRPDHEGTVFADDFDEDDEIEDEEVDVVTGLSKKFVEDSLLESLLDDDETIS
jgi:condensin complex subunit 3